METSYHIGNEMDLFELQLIKESWSKIVDKDELGRN